MKETDKWSVAAGTVLTIGGGIMTLIGLFLFPLLVYGIPALIIGIVILTTLKKQEEIEQIRTSKKEKK